MEIIEIKENKKQFLPLLLLADEQESMIDRYIDRGTMYVLGDNGVKCECVVTDEGKGILEIKNIATVPEYQGKGYGKALIDFVAAKYKGKYSILQVGTGDSPLTVPFYEKSGFVRSHSIKNFFVLIGLIQLGTRCSDGSCEAAEDLISGFSAIEAEAELVQIGLKLCAAAVISAEQERFQVADGFVQPVQVARFIMFRVQLHARQVLIASVAVAFDFCTCRNSFADDLLKCFARDVFHDLHPREQRSPVFRF